MCGLLIISELYRCDFRINIDPTLEVCTLVGICCVAHNSSETILASKSRLRFPMYVVVVVFVMWILNYIFCVCKLIKGKKFDLGVQRLKHDIKIFTVVEIQTQEIW